VAGKGMFAIALVWLSQTTVKNSFLMEVGLSFAAQHMKNIGGFNKDSDFFYILSGNASGSHSPYPRSLHLLLTCNA